MERSFFFLVNPDSVRKEIEKFDPGTIWVAKEPIRPEDVVIRELNEFEQKFLLWMEYISLNLATSLPEETINDMRRNKKRYLQFMEEEEMRIARVEMAMELFAVSLHEGINNLLKGFNLTSDNTLSVREGRFLVLAADYAEEDRRVQEETEKRTGSVSPQSGEAIN